MFAKTFNICVLAGCISGATLIAPAQQIVHALSGTVNAVDSKEKTITVITDDGSAGFFHDLGTAKVSIEFNKKIRAEATAADTFSKTGNRVILFYYGFGEDRTAVALRDLGAGPFENTSGHVEKLDKGAHTITIKTEAGTSESFHFDAATVAESDSGPVQGDKFDARTGEQVRVISAGATGSKTALFIVQLSL